MKKMIFVMMIIFALTLTGSCKIMKRDGVRAFREDYIKKYERTFNEMFEDNWKVIATESKYEDPEEICSHVDTRTVRFIEWTIEYYDGNGNPVIFVFDNRSSLSDQIQSHVKDYIKKYYRENFFDTRFKDMAISPSSYVFCFFARMTVNRDEKDNIERTKKADKYLKNLETPDGAINLSRLTPANAFEICPIYLSIYVSLSGHPDDADNIEEDVKAQIEAMAEEMNEFTGNKLNASIRMGYRDVSGRSVYWTYLQGKQVYDTAGTYFERHVFDSYKGIFW
ncbi:MAG: hypothetical protein GX757_13080 [Clostridiales bacterium]|nr:hypothetical protein [Clostridiales bacterium]